MKTRSHRLQTQYPLRLSEDSYNMLRAEAEARGCSVNALIGEIIDTHLLEHRAELVELIGRAATERYAVVLDKLKDL